MPLHVVLDGGERAAQRALGRYYLGASTQRDAVALERRLRLLSRLGLGLG
jgi:hypothetical protein